MTSTKTAAARPATETAAGRFAMDTDVGRTVAAGQTGADTAAGRMVAEAAAGRSAVDTDVERNGADTPAGQTGTDTAAGRMVAEVAAGRSAMDMDVGRNGADTPAAGMVAEVAAGRSAVDTDVGRNGADTAAGRMVAGVAAGRSAMDTATRQSATGAMAGRGSASTAAGRAAQDWVRILARYRDPSTARSLFELAATLLPFGLLWGLAWLMLSVSYLLTLAIAVLNGLFLVRIFCIQHDCGHAAFFHSRRAQDWVGRCLGVLTLTPYDVWRRTHALHHAQHGNLDRRGIGDVLTLTVAEYRARGPLGRLLYRLYRHPLVLFVLGPSYLFVLENRLPLGLMTAGLRYWVSAMGTNAAITILLALIVWAGGFLPVLLIYVPTTVVAATIGVWLFYVQHQFEETHWSRQEDWQLHEAALEGSSHYVLPQPLRWLSANIGIHHVHHLYSRIPFYRLPEVLRDHGELAQAQRLTPRESLRSVRLHLWDEAQGRLLSFAEARRLYGSG